MKLLRMPITLTKENQQLLHKQLFDENIQRCKLFAKIVIIFELILILLNLFTKYSSGMGILTYDYYLIMYMLLTFLSCVLLLTIRSYENGDTNNQSRSRIYEYIILAFVILFLLWGAAITLADQQQYGHLMAFIVNIMCVSVLFHASNRTILFLYLLPV
uniref:hypothetical protein n=1 Tax=Radiobacillus sp. PE A8.2 TaxID=3380349 RepID=UPI00388D65C6